MGSQNILGRQLTHRSPQFGGQPFCSSSPNTLEFVSTEWNSGVGALQCANLRDLAVRLHEFNKSMYGRMDHTATPPSQVAIGRDGKTGQFKTMEHKEYPKRFCEAIAGAICDHLERDLRLGKCRSVPVNADLFAWLGEAAKALEQQKLAGPLPDFQG